MPIAQSLLAEFEAQAPLTRRFLERLPEDKLTWKPHSKSLTAGQLAYHLATTPGGVLQLTCTNPCSSDGPPGFPEPASLHEVLDKFDENSATVRKVLPTFDDQAMNETWNLDIAGHRVVAMPRIEFLRNVMFSHWYQHRGQFSVYLRLLDVPVPATWGPSADEMPSFVREMQSARGR
jgi:uncharacterized damage-inducible protein DinB